MAEAPNFDAVASARTNRVMEDNDETDPVDVIASKQIGVAFYDTPAS